MSTEIPELDREIEQAMVAGSAPGLAVACVRDGRSSYIRGFGTMRVDGGGPVRPDTLFRIGSTTKLVFGTAMMRLVERGEVDLDRPVNEYLKWITFADPNAGASITIRMLLTHTAGLPSEFVAAGADGPCALEQSLRIELPRARLLFEPGRHWSYSNLGIRLAGHIAEVATGRSFAELIDELVLTPVGMARTTFDPQRAVALGLAFGHRKDRAGRLYACDVDHNAARYPSGGLFSCAEDLVRFAMLHLARGRLDEQRLVTKRALAEMYLPHADRFTLARGRYGLAIESEQRDGVEIVGHPGSHPPYGSWLILAPDENAAVVLLVSGIDGFRSFAARLVDRLLEFAVGRPLPSPSLAATGAVAETPVGANAETYLHPHYGLVQLWRTDDRVLLAMSNEVIPLERQRTDLYAGRRTLDGAVICLGLPEGEREQASCIVLDSVPSFRIERDTLPEIGRTELSSLVGTYRSAALDITQRVILADEGLMLWHSRVERQVPLTAISRTRFACAWGVRDFELDAAGRVERMRACDIHDFERE